MNLLNKLTQKVNKKVIRKELERKAEQRSKFWATVPTELLKRCLSERKEDQETAFNELIELHNSYCEKLNIKGSLLD